MKGLVASAIALVTVFAAGGFAYHHSRNKGHAEAGHGRPVFAAAPDRAPATRFVHRRICSEVPPAAASQASAATHGLVWVDPHPDGGIVTWHPGMNSTSCQAALTHLSERQARAFAEAVDRGKRVPPGSYSCPTDDGSGVTVYLTYPHQQGSEVVDVDLEGCRWAGAPGRAARSSDAVDVLGKVPAGLH